MSHIQRYYISEVLEYMCDLLMMVSDKVFSEHRPSATEQMSDFIVVSIPNTIDDQNAYQKGYLRIELYVRDKQSGIANTVRLQEMLNGLSELYPIVTNRFSITSPQLVLKGADTLGFTVWNIQSKLLINTTDSYQH